MNGQDVLDTNLAIGTSSFSVVVFTSDELAELLFLL